MPVLHGQKCPQTYRGLAGCFQRYGPLVMLQRHQYYKYLSLQTSHHQLGLDKDLKWRRHKGQCRLEKSTAVDK